MDAPAPGDEAPARHRRGPVDPRLLRLAGGVREVLVAGIVVSTATAVLIIVQAFALGEAIAAVVQGGVDLPALCVPLVLLALAVLGRAGLAWAGEVLAQRAASRTSGELRRALLEHVVRLGPTWLSGRRRSEVSALATRGVDAIEPYVARYLPSLVLAVVVPLTVGITIATQDLLSAMVLIVTVPLIPLFMALIGLQTRRATDRQWRALSVLSSHFLDVVTGLPTLKAFGRAGVQQQRIAAVDATYRRATMRVLRVSFLSSMVLELLATLSVAVVAVAIGLRLLAGTLDLRTGLVVLILTPEVYLPIRLASQQFHAAADGVTTADLVFEVLDTHPPANPSATPVRTPDLAGAELVVDHVSVTYPGRAGPAMAPVSCTLRPGRVTALTGASGVGKSTLLAVLMGFLSPTAGQVWVGRTLLTDIDPDIWRRSVAWVGQDPVLLGPTVGDDVRMGRPDATDAEVLAALAATGLHPEDLGHGLQTAVGDLASAVSTGQRRRVALARALVRRTPFVLLDEPTASLDPATEQVVVGTLGLLAQHGAAVLVVAHRPAVVAAADDVVLMMDADQTVAAT